MKPAAAVTAADPKPAAAAPAPAAALPLALPSGRHTAKDGELYLGGNFLELGISEVGSFGTEGDKPAEFNGGTPPGNHPDSVGLVYDSDGFGKGTAPALDFYVPDTPEERWSVGYNNTNSAGFSALGGSDSTLTNSSLKDKTVGTTLGAEFTGTVDNNLKVKQDISFDVNQPFYTTVVTLTNVSDTKLTNVEYMRSFDPDGTRSVGGDNTTTNVVGGQYVTDGYALVTASSLEGDAYNVLTGNLAVAFFYAAADPRVRVYTGGFTNSNPYEFDTAEQATGYTEVDDSAIGIILKAGDLAPGKSATFTYITGVTTGADPLALVKKVKALPVPSIDTGSAELDTSLHALLSSPQYETVMRGLTWFGAATGLDRLAKSVSVIGKIAKAADENYWGLLMAQAKAVGGSMMSAKKSPLTAIIGGGIWTAGYLGDEIGKLCSSGGCDPATRARTFDYINKNPGVFFFDELPKASVKVVGDLFATIGIANKVKLF